MKDGEMLAADCEAMIEAEGFKKSTIKRQRKAWELSHERQALAVKFRYLLQREFSVGF